MLVEFKYKNFLSYKDETSLLMTKVKSFKELEKTNIINNDYFDLLKTAAIYGTNGGGKSNLVKAMGFMKSVVHNSFADSLKKEEDRSDKDYFFKLNDESENEPSMFEVSFIKNYILYRYGFEIKGYELISEWLTKKKETETILFEREFQNFKIKK